MSIPTQKEKFFIGEQNIIHLIRQSWLFDVGTVLGIRGAAVGIAFLANAFLGRAMGPSGYGQFAILISIMTITAGLFGPALDTSLVHFASRELKNNPCTFNAYFKLVFYIKLVVGIALLLLGYFLSDLIIQLFFHSSTSNPLNSSSIRHAWIMMAVMGGVIMMMWGFAQSYYQVHEQFVRYAGSELMNSILRMSFVVLLILFGFPYVYPALWAYIAAPILVAIWAWIRIPKTFMRSTINFLMFREFIHFGKWVILASLFTSVAQRSDLLLLAFFKSSHELVGNYNAAVNLMLVGDMVVLTFYNVLLPKASHIDSASAMSAFLRRYMKPALLCGVAVACLLPMSNVFATLTFGEAFSKTGTLFAILLGGTLASLACAPATVAVYGIGRSRLIAMLEALRLTLCLSFGLWAVPRYGAIGMAWTMTIIRCTIGVVTYLAVRVEIREFRRVEKRKRV